MERFDAELLVEDPDNYITYIYRKDGDLVKAEEVAYELKLALGQPTDEASLHEVNRIITRLTRKA